MVSCIESYTAKFLYQQPAWLDESFIPILTYAMWVIISIIFLSLLILFIWRFYLQLREKRRQLQREKCSTLIYSFLDKDIDQESIQLYLSEHENQIPLFSDICIDLTRDLEGRLKKRLQQLLHVSSIQNHYKKELKSQSVGDITGALIFYKYCPKLNLETAETIEPFLNHKNEKVAFSAALAMVNAKEIAMQYEGLKVLSCRKDISQLAILELMVFFTKDKGDNFKRKGKMIMKLIVDNQSIPKSRIVLIKALGEFGFYDEALRLYLVLKANFNGDYGADEKVIGALIEALGKLQEVKILSQIKSIISFKKSELLKISCAKALGSIGGEKSIELLHKLFEDDDKNVQHEAMIQFLKIGKPALDFMPDINRRSYPAMEKQTLQELIEMKDIRYD